MKDVESELIKWSEQLAGYHLPRWQELPDIDLYMDQVVTLIEKYLKLLSNDDSKIITPAMINNYVKLGLIPPPIKKRYTRTHIAYLIAISILKQVLTIAEVRNGIIFQSKVNGTKEAFNLFCEEQEKALQAISAHMGSNKITPILHEKITTENLALRMATLAFASKIIAEKTIQIQKEVTSKAKESE
ncbi:DUF1836 domain-containing protein [Brevibacillus daliensis]|uniref:DUF1836 domain-containing protein n=1 Tax=Brevibacillus daliensis TaxID=2892995 RepID=UPI001E33A21A|nr:DUF1836 domain-containing protein [Brevibacillus daliensis]